jgi:peptidoglycan/LPS O-acetylase OafA/YrhL
MASNIYNKFRRITSNQLYFPEIDGIRFLAITLVILFHTHGYFARKSTIKFADDPSSYSWLNKFLENGDRGVELFFVLSGFILCLPFAHQYINKGKKISLKKYYLRRVTRLEPPYFIAMTAIFLLQLAIHIKPFAVLCRHWLASLAYSHDLIYHQTPLLTVVAWSLEIEIQFYLLAPFLFRLLALNVILRRFILLAATVLLIFCQSIYPPPFLNIYGYAQYFFTGILLADLYVSDTASAIFRKNWILPLAAICLLLICYLPVKDLTLPTNTLFFLKLALTLLIGIFYYMIFRNDTLRNIFSYKFIPVIGGMCYSIYLLHYTIISIVGSYALRIHFTNYYLPNLLTQIILLGIPVLALSSVFYFYIERPFMSRKWMDKLMKPDKHKEIANMQSELPQSEIS